jgi:hypothetical protein
LLKIKFLVIQWLTETFCNSGTLKSDFPFTQANFMKFTLFYCHKHMCANRKSFQHFSIVIYLFAGIGANRKSFQHFSIVIYLFAGIGANRKSFQHFSIARAGFELTTLVVIHTDCIGSCQSNYHTIMTTMPSVWQCQWTWWSINIIKNIDHLPLNHIMNWFLRVILCSLKKLAINDNGKMLQALPISTNACK